MNAIFAYCEGWDATKISMPWMVPELPTRPPERVSGCRKHIPPEQPRHRNLTVDIRELALVCQQPLHRILQTGGNRRLALFRTEGNGLAHMNFNGP
jgi:hypothetical protein